MAEKNAKIRTRFAPSPTGMVHIGSLRTALFSFLFARHNGGVNILRIEDTDQNRFIEGTMENLLKVMKRMGVEFDEGLLLDNEKIAQRGGFGPYIQSERKQQGLYQKYADQLIKQGAAYYCFCSEERLEELRKEQTALKKPPMYDRLCRNLDKDEVIAKLAEFKAAGKNPVIRQAIPLDGQTVIHDLIYGDVTYDNKLIDDQIILKSDGYPTYHLAVVVDDHLMEITHVIRGEEWIPSTPKHLMLYAAFGWEPTAFAHLPLILNPDKSKLSKRKGDVSVESFLLKGYLPEALINFVVLLGWNPKTEKEVFTLEELIQEFDLSKVNKSGAVFDIQKLDWINSQWIRQKGIGELVELLVPYWKQYLGSFDQAKYKKDYLEQIANLEKERLKKLSEIGERTYYFFEKPKDYKEILVSPRSDAAKTEKGLQLLKDYLEKLNETDFNKDKLESGIKELVAKSGLDNNSVLWPMRVALTGLEKSPGPFEVASVLVKGLGKNEVINRINEALNQVKN